MGCIWNEWLWKNYATKCFIGYRKYTKGTIKLFSQELNRSNAVFLR